MLFSLVGGVPWDNPTLVELAQKVAGSPHLHLQGLYTEDASVPEIKRREMEVEEMMDSTKGYEIMRELNDETMGKFLQAAKRLVYRKLNNPLYSLPLGFHCVNNGSESHCIKRGFTTNYRRF